LTPLLSETRLSFHVRSVIFFFSESSPPCPEVSGPFFTGPNFLQTSCEMKIRPSLESFSPQRKGCYALFPFFPTVRCGLFFYNIPFLLFSCVTEEIQVNRTAPRSLLLSQFLIHLSCDLTPIPRQCRLLFLSLFPISFPSSFSDFSPPLLVYIIVSSIDPFVYHSFLRQLLFCPFSY